MPFTSKRPNPFPCLNLRPLHLHCCGTASLNRRNGLDHRDPDPDRLPRQRPAQKHLRKHPNPDSQSADPGDGADRPRVRLFFGDRRSQPQSQSQARHEARDGLAHHVLGELAHRILYPRQWAGRVRAHDESGTGGGVRVSRCGLSVGSEREGWVEGIREDGEGMDVFLGSALGGSVVLRWLIY